MPTLAKDAYKLYDNIVLVIWHVHILFIKHKICLEWIVLQQLNIEILS